MGGIKEVKVGSLPTPGRIDVQFHSIRFIYPNVVVSCMKHSLTYFSIHISENLKSPSSHSKYEFKQKSNKWVPN